MFKIKRKRDWNFITHPRDNFAVTSMMQLIKLNCLNFKAVAYK